MNQLLRLLEQGQVVVQGAQAQQQGQQAQQQGQQGPAAGKESAASLDPPLPTFSQLLLQHAQAQAAAQAAVEQVEALWGHDVVVGLPHAVLLDHPGAGGGLEPPFGGGVGLAGAAAELGEAESAIMGLPRAASMSDFLS